MAIQRKTIAGLLERSGQSFVYRPAPRYSRMNSLVGYACFFAPFSNRKSLPFELKERCSAPVPALSFSISPTAIFRAIRAVYVNSVNGVLRGGCCTHISEEVSKIRPTLANLNATPAIHRVINTILFCAASFHHRPSVVLLGTPPAIRGARLPMNGESLGSGIFMQTPTGSSVAIDQLARRDNTKVSTKALTQPMNSVGFIFASFFGCEPVKSFVREV